ncbi:MAG: TonB-dependent receptor [Gemmatimonadales bacterium]|uniref:TonB-dependent receptor n=1 Tax=Candidatus Palauibacter irciniicola TaxID=3056733 RepID=UPI00137D7EDD|nr:TonB-dependent receptor [Candidatus Palauibacter irciniicola]MYC17484.1 TonB-dependent receptor [Gemmatimonadales bacterium]
MVIRRLAGLITAALAMAVGATGSSAQVEHPGEIEGVVRDADSDEPLAGALISIAASGRTAVSHGDGTFHVPVPGPRVYTVRIERLGYRTVSLEVDASREEIVVVEMEAHPISLPDLVVTGSVVARVANEVLRPTSVFAGEDLQRRLAGTLAETLSSEPGLAVSSMGPSSVHPVIRGLSGDRILMLEDGERVGDEFASGPDHATAIDPSSARRVEVIRGPGAILYGSNALGGVINVVRDDVPSSVPHHLTGAFTLQGQTVSNAASGSLHLTYGLTDRIPVRLELGLRSSGDLKTPVGPLQNTSTDVREISGGTSWVDDWGHAGATFRYYGNDYGIPGGFVGGHEAGVRVEMQRTATRLRSVLRPSGAFESVEIDAGHTWYEHREIEPPDILGTLFERQTVSGEVLARHRGLGPFSSGGVGTRASWEDFGFGGSLFTPNSTQASFAVFALEEVDLNPIRLEAGLRYDWVRVRPDREDPSSDIGHIRERSFGAVSGSLGALAQLTPSFTVGASVARAFRTPSVNELFSEGPHLAAYAFEVGNPSLETERGTGIDLFARLTGDRLNAEISWFHNAIADYVFPLETGELSRVRLPIFQFQGEDAVLTGFESALEWAPVGDLTLEAVASYVQGRIEATDEPLPLIPPLQGRFAIGYAPRNWFVEAETRVATRQNRTGAFETPTDGYAVFDLSAGLRITVMGRLNVITVRGENLGNAVYRNHLSRVKEIMPEAGRSITVAYRVVF